MRRFSLYKIMFHDNALSWESIILSMPPRNCKAYSIAILLHDHCAIQAPPPPPPLNTIHYTILAMAVSCKGQATMRFGLYPILPFPFLCAVYCNSGGSGGSIILRNSVGDDGGGGVPKQRVGAQRIVLMRAQSPETTISCIGQDAKPPSTLAFTRYCQYQY